MALHITPTTTRGMAPPAAAASKTANLLTNPLVKGIPANANRNNANTMPNTGARRPTPAHRRRSVTSSSSL
ncbi:Uncharacterised protein [Mycobacteroides abscessus]|nr:Uncharacterised protein [Mycobacteroides abscessus]